MLIVVQNLPVPLDRRVWLECQALVDAGIGVSVVCPKGPGDPDFEILEGVHVHKYAPPRQAQAPMGFLWEFAVCWVLTARLAWRVHRREGFDALQACNPPDTYWLLGRFFRLFGVQFVFDQHDLCPELYLARFPQPSQRLHRALGWLERASYRTADHVIVTNGSAEVVARTRGQLPPERVSQVRSGPLASRMRRGLPDPSLKAGRRHLCVYLGVMGPQDGVDVLVRAIAQLVQDHRRVDTHFALLGFGDCLDDLRELARELGVGDRVTFTGRADDRMIHRYLSTADVAVSPDPPNGFNENCTMNKVLEYMAYGVPVVAFDLTETRVSAGDACCYVHGTDPAALAAGIGSLLDDPDRRRDMGALGRSRLVRSLSWEHQGLIYADLYRRLLDMAPPLVVDLTAEAVESLIDLRSGGRAKASAATRPQSSAIPSTTKET